MFERFIPKAQKLLLQDPISAFGDLFRIAHDVLRMLDVFGIYKGRSAPKPRHRALAKKLLHRVKPSRLAEQLSASRLRDFQNTGFLLDFMAEATPAKFRSTVAAMDWSHIAATIGDQWKNLPHDAEVLFGIAYQAKHSQDKIVQVIHDNLYRIEAFPPRLVIVAPNAAYEHAERGGLIRLAQYDQVDLQFGVAVIACFAEKRPNLLEAVLKPSEISTGRLFSSTHPSAYAESAEYVHLLREKAPLSLQRILDAVDVQGAEKGWKASLRDGRGPRKTVALLVDSSLGRSDDLGKLAKRLCKRFPKSSVPGND